MVDCRCVLAVAAALTTRECGIEKETYFMERNDAVCCLSYRTVQHPGLFWGEKHLKIEWGNIFQYSRGAVPR